MGKVMGSCVHELEWSNKRQEFGYSVMFADYDRHGERVVVYSVYCLDCFKKALVEDECFLCSEEDADNWLKSGVLPK